MKYIQENTFAEACYNMNTIEDLREALEERRFDSTDAKAWDLTEEEYFEQIELAIKQLEADEE